MTVSEVNDQKIVITLTNTEVIGAFGGYERLYTMTGSIKSAINSLLRDIISEHQAFSKNGKILARIKAKKYEGCEITLSVIGNRKENNEKEYAFFFPNTESLTQAVLQLSLKKNNLKLPSSLYKTENGYHLIIQSNNIKDIYILNEFCLNKNNLEFLCEYIKEYGKPLIKDNAIKTYAAAFTKAL